MSTTMMSVDAAYLRLVKACPLRAITSQKQADLAVEFLEALAVKDESKLTAGEAEYLLAQTALIEAWEQAQERLPSNPLGALKFLLKEHNMTASDFGRLLGNRSLGSNVLTGKRELSKENVRKLAEYFKVSPALFF